MDEITTLRPESTAHGPAAADHSYYISLRFVNCESYDIPSLSSYSLAILRITGADSSPQQIAFFNLKQHSPIMRTNEEHTFVILKGKNS